MRLPIGRRTIASIDLVKSRAKRLSDIVAQLRPLFPRTSQDAGGRRETPFGARSRAALAAWRGRLTVVAPFDPAALEAALRSSPRTRHQGRRPDSRHTRRGDRPGGQPWLFEVLALVGRERVLKRLDAGS